MVVLLGMERDVRERLIEERLDNPFVRMGICNIRQHYDGPTVLLNKRKQPIREGVTFIFIRRSKTVSQVNGQEIANRSCSPNRNSGKVPQGNGTVSNNHPCCDCHSSRRTEDQHTQDRTPPRLFPRFLQVKWLQRGEDRPYGAAAHRKPVGCGWRSCAARLSSCRMNSPRRASSEAAGLRGERG